MQVSVWKLAQSNLAGCSAHFLIGLMGNVAQRARICLIQTTLVPRGQFNGMSKHFFTEAGTIRHCKQEGLQPCLVALFKHCNQPGSKGFIALY